MARPDRHSLPGPDSRELTFTGMIRRMVVRVTKSITFWRVEGVFDDEGNVETFEAVPLAHPPGLAALPKAGARIEAIVLSVGGNSNNRVIVAARDQDLVKTLQLALDESVLHNSESRVHLKADGTIEARSHAGAAVPLATLADVEALRDWVAGQLGPTGHTHGSLGAPPTLGAGDTTQYLNDPANPAGTSKLKGE